MQVYGDDEAINEFSDVIALFSQPDVSKAREKLNTLAERLGVDLGRIPKFLQDYGDRSTCRSSVLPAVPRSDDSRRSIDSSIPSRKS